MEFKNDLISDLAEAKMIELRSKGVSLKGGAEYNRVFETIYELYKEIHSLKNEKIASNISETIKSWDEYKK